MKSSELVSIYKEYSKGQIPVSISINPNNSKAYADKLVLNRYGNFCSLGEKRETKDMLSFSLLADMPIRIDEEDQVSYNWIKIGEIGKVKVSRFEPYKIDAPTLPQILKMIKQKYYNFRNDLEAELVIASEYKFATIDEIRHFMNPVSLLIELFDNDIKKYEVSKGISFADVLKIDYGERWINYLINSGLINTEVTMEGKKAFPTKIMKSYKDTSTKSNKYSFEDMCLGKIFTHNHEAVSKVNPIFKSYLKFTHSIYQASFERGRMLSVSDKIWIDQIYSRRYGKPKPRFREMLRLIYTKKLKKSKLIIEKNGKYSPNEEVYEPYIQRIKENLSQKYPITLEKWGGCIG